MEKTKSINKRPPRVDTIHIGSKKIEFQLELEKPIRHTTTTTGITKDLIQQSTKGNQQATEIKDIVTNTIIYEETTRIGGQWWS